MLRLDARLGEIWGHFWEIGSASSASKAMSCGSFKNVSLPTSEKVSWEKGQKPQNLQKWVLGAVSGHSLY